MKKAYLVVAMTLLAVLFVTPIAAQKRPKKGPVKPAAKRPIIFAVISDGKWLEPIALVDNKVLKEPVSGGGANVAELTAFGARHYVPGTKYRLIFGGKQAGTVRVESSDPSSDCTSNQAQNTYSSPSAKLKGNVMALATNVPTTTVGSGVRRLPTAAERASIEALVRTKFTEHGVPAGALSPLQYLNLTALDVDSDGKEEFVGTFWAKTSADKRTLLFFIAQKGSSGIELGYSELADIPKAEVMSDDLSDVDRGILQEKLLDVFDVDGDGTAEVFSIDQSFEGATFRVYRRTGAEWRRIYEFYNYHCGF